VGADIKGDAYEGLLERNARDTKYGAGQSFTPRPVIDAMVACVAPRPGDTIIDPACGTGGFLLAAHSYLTATHPDLTREQREHLRLDALHARQPTYTEATPDGRWRAYDDEEIIARDKCSLDLFWLKDESLLDAESLPEPDVIAQEIADDLRGALAQIEEILVDLGA
jgi:hypothetical protein